jgi:hypothetical protein
MSLLLLSSTSKKENMQKFFSSLLDLSIKYGCFTSLSSTSTEIIPQVPTTGKSFRTRSLSPSRGTQTQAASFASMTCVSLTTKLQAQATATLLVVVVEDSINAVLL